MPSPTHPASGLLLGKVDYRDSDLVVSFFTREFGRVSALARAARRSQKRFGGVLEPMHSLRLELEGRASSELMTLREASIQVARTRLTTRLEAIELAGRALIWVRASTPQAQAEPLLYQASEALLDRLNAESFDRNSPCFLAEFGLNLIATAGFGIDFEKCVRCGRPCEASRAAYVDARRGGLVCRSCGGASKRLAGPRRERLARAGEGETGVLLLEDVDDAVALVEQSLEAHLGVERR